MDERAAFYHSVSLGLNAGLTLRRALESAGRPDLAALVDGRPAASILESAGMPARDIAVVAAAEASGKVDRAIRRLGEAAEAEAGLRRRLRNAALYPAILLHAAVIVPWIAAWFMGHADLKSLVSGLAGIWVLLAAATALLRSPVRDALPVVGSISRELALSRFCRTLAWMLDAAVPLRRAIDLSADAAGGHPGRTARAAAAGDLGRPLHQILASSLPPLTLEILRSGEEAGSIDRMLEKAAAIHASQALHTLDLLTRLAPLVFFLVIAVGMVGIIAALAGTIAR